MSISAGYREHELLKIWEHPESHQRRLLRPALAKLYEDPNVSQNYLNEWISVLRECAQVAMMGRSVAFKPRTTPVGGHDRFFRLCMGADLANAMLRLSELTNLITERSKIHALSIWGDVVAIASTDPEVTNRVKSDRLEIKASLLRSLKSDMFMHRAHAVLCLRNFAWGPWAKYLSHEDVAEIMAECLSYASADHQSVLDELKTRGGGWQKELMREMADVSDSLTTEEAQAFAPRFYSLSRHEALNVVAGLLYTRDLRTVRRDCRDIIYAQRQILDQLLTIVGFDRSPWHPEGVSDSIAAQLLSYLLQTPHCSLPELWDETISFRQTDFHPQARGGSDVNWVMDEWIAQLESLKLFVDQCPCWRQRILEKWKKLQNETCNDIIKKFGQAVKHMALRPPDAADLDDAIKERGACRACLLRILTNLTHGRFESDHDSREVVSVPELLSLLPLAYEASQKVPSAARAARSKRHANGVHGRDALLRLERSNEVLIVPSKANYGRKCLACDVIFPEYILGPVLLFRILRRINEWNSKDFGAHITSWEFLPPDTPESTDIGQIKQVSSPEILNILMRNVVLKRIPTQKDMATGRLRHSVGEDTIQADYARSGYLAAAELAIAVEQYNSSAGPYKSSWEDIMVLVKKERIACLGNISEMSSRLGEWGQQYWYARHAISTVDDWRQSAADLKVDGWDPEAMRAKNERRLTAAKKNILARYAE